jgi:SAM-dependent methyltransferase
MTDNLPKTKEAQYELLFRVREKHGISRFGLMANESWNEDPRRTLFTLARYKFVAKMLSGRNRVLEIGCADAFGTRLVQQEVNHVTAVDFDPIFIEDVRSRMNPNWPIDCFVHDILSGPVPGSYDAAFCLDVFEHIAPENERHFLENMYASLNSHGVAVIGIPSLESQVFASPQSKAGHVNCKSGRDFKRILQDHFHNVFVFSMNDEVVHTGFFPMAHYLIAVACEPKSNPVVSHVE